MATLTSYKKFFTGRSHFFFLFFCFAVWNKRSPILYLIFIFNIFYILIVTVGSLLWRKNISMHYLVFPMICMLRYPEIVNTSHLILINVPCLNIILTNSMQNITFCLFTIATLGFANYRKESICNTYYYNW